MYQCVALTTAAVQIATTIPLQTMTSRTPSASGGRRRAHVAILVVTVLLVALSAMVWVPPFSLALFPLAIGASEYSPVLVLLDLLWCLPVNRVLRPIRGLRYATLAALAVSACVAVGPLTQYTRVAAAASEQLGAEDLPPRFSLMAAFTGLPTSNDVVERVTPYAAPTGERLVMRTYSPRQRTVRPAIVVLYGGAWERGTSAQAANVSRALASHGYVVAAMDYRHAPISRYPAQVDDVNRGLLLLRDSADAWGIDVARMAVLGRSSGGHLAELAAYASSGSPFRAVIAIYAPYDLVQGYMHIPSPDPLDVRAVLRSFLDGTPEDRLARYRAASPASYIRTGLPPTLLIFGGRDHVVKPEFNRAAAQALRAAHVPVVAVELPWAEHAFDLAPTGLGGQLAFNVMVDFLSQHLKASRTSRLLSAEVHN